VETMNIELIGYIDVNTIGKTESVTRNNEYWSMQFGSKKRHIKKSRANTRRRNG